MRKRVDWDAEIQKTEKIRRKGILMSAVSFAAACAFIFGMSKFTGAPDESGFSFSVEIPKAFLFAVLFVVSFVIFRAIVKNRKRKKENAE